MKKLKLLNYIFILFVLVLLVGCSINPKIKGFSKFTKNLPGMPKIGEDKTGLFYEGSKGVEFEIIRPSEEHYYDSPFYVRVYLSNKGMSDAGGEICLYGLDEDIFLDFDSCTCERFSLGGVSYVGEQKKEGDDYTFEFGPYEIDDSIIEFYEKKDSYIKESDEFVITSSVIYDYQTYGVIEACIRKDINDKEGCSYKNKDMLKGVSGAPIQITSVKEEIIPSGGGDYKLIFDVEIKNKGNGFVTDDGECGSLGKDGSIKVKLLNVPSRVKEVECKDVKLKDDKAVAHCVIDEVEGKDYKTDITIILNYNYKEIKSKKLKVVKNEI
jgi:hypothetical protein